jgi:uncharacterized protein (TIGR02466 family)
MQYNLFPITVETFRYNRAAELKAAILEQVLPLATEQVTNGTGTVSYYQSTNNQCVSLFDNSDHPEVIKFRQFCLESAAIYASRTLEYQIERMVCVGSWVNVYRESSGQDSHFHGNSLISANYFLNYQNHTPLTFWNPQASARHVTPVMNTDRKTNLQNPGNFSWANLPCTEGEIIFFPSWLNHSVECQDNNNRVTVSMNFMPNKVMWEGYGFEITDKYPEDFK